MDALERFASKYRVAESGCWEWTAHVSSSGYGRFNIDRSPKYAHRISYEIHVGPIPAGMHIDHLCKNRVCVNPDHLEAVTQAENNRRSRSDTCIRRHKFDGVVRRRGRPTGRRCLTCHRRRNYRGETSVSPVKGQPRVSEA